MNKDDMDPIDDFLMQMNFWIVMVVGVILVIAGTILIMGDGI